MLAVLLEAKKKIRKMKIHPVPELKHPQSSKIAQFWLDGIAHQAKGLQKDRDYIDRKIGRERGREREKEKGVDYVKGEHLSNGERGGCTCRSDACQ